MPTPTEKTQTTAAPEPWWFLLVEFLFGGKERERLAAESKTDPDDAPWTWGL